VIRSFGDRLSEDLFFDRNSRATRQFPSMLRAAAQRKLQYLNVATRLDDPKAPPGNRLEALRGDLSGFHSIRINDQWRIIFLWVDGAFDVRVVYYH